MNFKPSLYLLVLAIGSSFLGFVVYSPSLLKQLGHGNSTDWRQLSNIGQTYGAASAILSAIALIGVTSSLLIQARQAKIERIRVVRERHLELLQIVLADPELYGPVMGNATVNADRMRQHLYAVLQMNYARMGYQMGVLTESALRGDFFKSVFTSDITRAWWSDNRELWLASPVPDRRARKFAQIADDEYRRAISAGSPTSQRDKAPLAAGSPARSVRERWRVPTSMGLGVAVGVLAGARIPNRGVTRQPKP